MKNIVIGLITAVLIAPVSFAYEKPYTPVIELSDLEISNLNSATNMLHKDSTIEPNGAAPSLTNLSIYAILSENSPSPEYPSQYDNRTQNNHGGSWLRVHVLEIGYGGNQIAYLNGGILPSNALVNSAPLCRSSSGINFCKAGQTAFGFLNEYRLDGYQGGFFEVQDTSINPPIRTLRDSIDIW